MHSGSRRKKGRKERRCGPYLSAAWLDLQRTARTDNLRNASLLRMHRPESCRITEDQCGVKSWECAGVHSTIFCAS